MSDNLAQDLINAAKHAGSQGNAGNGNQTSAASGFGEPQILKRSLDADRGSSGFPDPQNLNEGYNGDDTSNGCVHKRADD
jgi:hypothetical protein